MLKNQKGLTLIELLAVVVILGIIAAIAIPSIGNIIQKSKEDAVKADAMQVISAAKTYVSANGIPEASGSGNT
ncbi:type II secretion system protein, partial [Priestia koreensis]|uniref:type II secretion system protein n=1 Tax=Priestia koreensis TaxID=284581 RepID=UPI0037CC1AAF